MSILSLAIQDIVETIRSINGAPTYENVVQNHESQGINQVEDFHRPMGMIPEDQFPHFNVVYKGEDKIKEPSHFKSVAQICIYVTFRNSSESEIASWLSDLEIALYQDTRRNSTVGVHDSVIRSIEQDDGSFAPIRLVKVNYELVYSYRIGNP